ncbi:MAG: hypothetical protein ACYT04_65430 [Nostoc sp.]
MQPPPKGYYWRMIQEQENSGGAMELLHPHRSDRYEAKRTYTSDRYQMVLMSSAT